jgi:hypothetical protein
MFAGIADLGNGTAIEIVACPWQERVFRAGEMKIRPPISFAL